MLVSPDSPYLLSKAAVHMGAGLVVGLCCLAAGWSIGQIGNHGVIALAKQEKLFTVLLMTLIFCEILGIFGFIVGILMCIT